MRPSMKVATSEVAVPRNADLLITAPLMTGRSLFHSVAVIVDASSRIERTRGREHGQSSRRDVVRKR